MPTSRRGACRGAIALAGAVVLTMAGVGGRSIRAASAVPAARGPARQEPSALHPASAQANPADQAAPPAPGGSFVERDGLVARQEAGPHHGLGRTTGYVFFQQVPGVPFSFRKRVLHPGASIGYHRQTEDEVYYVVSGTGRMTIDAKEIDVAPGDAVLTRPGSSHGLVQTGNEDLTLVIVFPTATQRAAAPAQSR